MKSICIIGNTDQGGYGHSLDVSFTGVEGAEVVAVSDPIEEGRNGALERSGAREGYADYEEMLKTERPDIAVIATHDLRNHLEYVQAAAACGAHLYVEKPLARTPEEVDQMLETCDKANVALVMAHPWRGRPQIQKSVIPMIREGRIGEPRTARMYGFGGDMGGDQWFIDLYPHFFDFLWQVFGGPTWCHGHITQDGCDATPADIKEGAFGMGLTCGNGIWVHYQFNGFNADFESFKGDGKENPYRIDIHGTEGSFSLPGPCQDGPDVYFHPLTNPQRVGDDRWEILEHEEVPGRQKWINAHHRLACSMMDMLDGKEPEYELCLGQDVRKHIELAMAARVSHIEGRRITLPLNDTENPFESWTE